MSAAVAAFAFVFASLLGWAHDATTSHVRCAAHGELVDSDAGPANTAVAGPLRDTLTAAQHSARGLADEHCTLASAVRESRVAPRTPSLVAATVRVAALAVIAPPAARATVTSVYRIAPKTSPPA
jgi:hypothetical protein